MQTRLPARKSVLTWTAMLIVAGLSYGVYQAGNDTAAPPNNASTAIMGGEAVGHRYASRSWSLEYETLRASNDNSYIEAIGVHNAVIYRKDKPPIRASADRVTINLASKDFDIEGNVKVEATLGGAKRVFETSGATWSETIGKLTMPGEVRLRGKGAVLTIAGITLDSHSGKAQFGRINGTVRP